MKELKNCQVCEGKGLVMDGASSTTTCDSCKGAGVSGGWREKANYLQSKLNDGSEGRFFMKRRTPHLLNIAEELLTWCIEEDKKGVYKGLIQDYRKEYENIIKTAN